MEATVAFYGEKTGSNVTAKKEKWIMHYSNAHSILLVGEGDFSFSACLARSFGSAVNMVATSRDNEVDLMKKHRDAKNHLDELKGLGCKLLYGIDVKDMQDDPFLKTKRFDRIIFNFPHAGHDPMYREWDEELILFWEKRDRATEIISSGICGRDGLQEDVGGLLQELEFPLTGTGVVKGDGFAGDAGGRRGPNAAGRACGFLCQPAEVESPAPGMASSGGAVAGKGLRRVVGWNRRRLHWRENRPRVNSQSVFPFSSVPHHGSGGPILKYQIGKHVGGRRGPNVPGRACGFLRQPAEVESPTPEMASGGGTVAGKGLRRAVGRQTGGSNRRRLHWRENRPRVNSQSIFQFSSVPHHGSGGLVLKYQIGKRNNLKESEN
ncbi:hypothetical protein KSP40_PGU009183 [Platanthera guangdongensis]|uniref:25S rRNA (uridine-N(3))-methyltransferase BMT5-like domain-containing protein n=1 Tax=Platanthera guangdongensis TaxID=2320717 RepID=A0ABR2LM48_9ASPA